MDLKLLLTPTQKEESRFESQDGDSSWQEERPPQQQQQQQQQQHHQQQQQQHSAAPHQAHHHSGNTSSHHGYHVNHQQHLQHQQHPHHQHAHQQQQHQFQHPYAYPSHENVHHQPGPTHNHPVPTYNHPVPPPPAADPAYHHHHHLHTNELSTSPAHLPILSRPPAMEPPLLSISSPSPMGASTQSTQYFVPSHHNRPSSEQPSRQQQQQPPQQQQQQHQQQQQPPAPPPSGLNLSSYGFLLMEKRDREREAMERANMNIINDLRAAKSASSSPAQSPAQVHATPPSSSSQRNQVDTGVHQSSTSPSSSSSYQRRSETSVQPHSGYSDSTQYFSHPSHAYYGQQQGYDQRYHGQPPMPHYAQQQFPQSHGHHSSFTANVGYGPGYEGYQYSQDYPGFSPAYGQALQHQAPPLAHRAASPSFMDKPRFANSNLSVFRQAAAEDSDGGASVSSSGSHKRRRRLKQPNGKKGSGLTQGHFLAPGSSPTGSALDYYDDDDSDEDNQDVRKSLQRLNLQKSIKTSASDQVKKPSKTAKPPFKIGELVESMKSDTDGTWFAGRVLDLEDDPHDHINPKSVLIHYEGFSPHHDEWVKPSQLRACSTGSSFLRYGPLGAESSDNWVAYEKFYNSELGRIARRHTGLVYDRRMLLHKCQCGTNPEEKHHPEQPERLVEILGQFQRLGMLSLVKWVQGREATMEELETAHTLAHVRNYCCTRAQNRQYALDHGLEWESSSEEEDNEEVIEDTLVEEGPAEEPAPKKRNGPGRPRKKRGGNNKQTDDGASTDISGPSKATATTAEDGAVTESNVSKIDTSTGIPVGEQHGKDDIDMLSPRLARRRSSMRGGIRISSMVSMSSTLYPQNEEGAPSPLETETPVAEDDDDDDDDKANQAGPPPSEAALAVAGGMDPSLASKLPTTSPVPSTLTTFVKQEDKAIGPMDGVDHDMEDAKDLVVSPEPSTISGATTTVSPLDASISKDNIIDKSRRTSRSMQGQSGLSAALETVSTAATAGSTPSKKEDEAQQSENTSVSNEITSRENKKYPGDKDKKDPKTANVTVPATSPSGTNTTTTNNNGSNVKSSNNNKKKPITKAVSPGPQPASDAVAIKPPGLIYTMTCGQLGIAVDTTWNPYYSPMAARVAAGSLIALVDQVVTGRCKNGFAIIRPPGHHAEEDEAMGFCFYNNVGVAVNLTLQRYPLTIQKILIIDWDVHHGNGTQQIFYDNPNVLYISLHRWDNGHFYPFTGAPDECGEEGGEGQNVNIAWSSYGRGQAMGDVEYIAAFWYVLLPIARQFGPDLVMVSAGFDAADGHANNIGGYTVSPQGFAIMTRLVQTLAGGRVILSLEGGYEFEPLATSAAACLEELLPHSLLPSTAPTRAFPYASFHGTLNSVKPNAMAVSSLHQVLKYQQKYWKFPPEVLNPNFRFHLPAEWKASNSLATRPRRERNTRRKAAMDT